MTSTLHVTFLEFRKQNFLNETEEPVSELIERTMKDLKLSEEHRVTEAGISLFADTKCNEERATATG